MNRAAAIGDLERGAGTQFDPLVVEIVVHLPQSWQANPPATTLA